MSKKELNLWMFALDPVHVGAGTAHLSHVDLEIIRDKADNLPKIPGTTIAGNARANADMKYWSGPKPKRSCAGQGSMERPHCGNCPICHGFGTLEKDEANRALFFRDALLLLFPLYSYSHGPIWITSQSRLDMLDGMVRPASSAGDAKPEVYTSMPERSAIVLGRRISSSVGALTITFPKDSVLFRPLAAILGEKRLAMVDDGLFSKLVNENLEVRTSVAIDPFTGTAAPGALFRYEALPRASLLLGSVAVEDDSTKWPHTQEAGWETPEKVLDHGLAPLSVTGLGRMGSRGFGRVRCQVMKVRP
jgi:CRISPR-associated protein Cmr4